MDERIRRKGDILHNNRKTDYFTKAFTLHLGKFFAY